MDVTTERSGKQQEFVVGDPTKATYRLVRKIGSGSFGDIYLGINTANGEEVRSFVGSIWLGRMGGTLQSVTMLMKALLLLLELSKNARSLLPQNVTIKYCIVLNSVRRTDGNRTKFTIFSSAVFFLAHLPDGSTSVMDNAVGCFAYGDMFSCVAFKLYLGSSDDIPTERIEEMALFSQFRDAPIPKPRDGRVVSGRWRRTRSRASTPVDSERPSERLD